jgi:hypothetical protein
LAVILSHGVILQGDVVGQGFVQAAACWDACLSIWFR